MNKNFDSSIHFNPEFNCTKRMISSFKNLKDIWTPSNGPKLHFYGESIDSVLNEIYGLFPSNSYNIYFNVLEKIRIEKKNILVISFNNGIIQNDELYKIRNNFLHIIYTDCPDDVTYKNNKKLWRIGQ